MKIAGVQMDVLLGQVSANLQTMERKLRETRKAGAELTIFPECALTGYCFESLAEALPHAQSISGPATDHFQKLCQELGGFVVFGLLEVDGERLFNATALVGAEGVIGSYRKVHLPYLGIDRFTTFGDRPFEVHQAGAVRLGMNICYDGGFPESSRCLSLLGADLIVLPTNWPPGAESMAMHATNARAMENGIYYAAVNRIGEERGFQFIGLSSICDPSGNSIARAEGTEETILYADIDPQTARTKRYVRRPGKHLIDRMADRRPEMYEPIVQPHQLPRPGRDESPE